MPVTEPSQRGGAHWHLLPLVPERVGTELPFRLHGGRLILIIQPHCRAAFSSGTNGLPHRSFGGGLPGVLWIQGPQVQIFRFQIAALLLGALNEEGRLSFSAGNRYQYAVRYAVRPG